MTDKIAEVAVENTFFSFGENFSYKIPQNLSDEIFCGCAVEIPFGKNNQKRYGIVLSIFNGDTSKLKEISRKVPNSVTLSDEFLKLSKWMKERYFTCEYECLKLMLPKGFGKIGDRNERMVRLKPNFHCEKITVKQQSVINLLNDVESASFSEVKEFCSVGDSVLKTLHKNGVIEFFEQEVYRQPYVTDKKNEKNEIVLSNKQQTAYEKLLKLSNSNDFKTALLFGITGSGKTQVYLKLIDDVVRKGKDVIVMVPEIALTVQTISIFIKRYSNQVAVFHSGLSLGERFDEYKRVNRGEAKIVIGTRSAVFAPVHNLGLIVIDEEQESSYKSEMSPKYNAKDVSKFRCAYNKCLLVLASATPSVESYSLAEHGKYELCEIDERYGNSKLPEVITVDMKNEYKNKNFSPISSKLAELLKSNYDSGFQSILLINRRGYNTFIACQDCGHVITCPNCSISLTYHSVSNRLQCHYCGYTKKLDNICPECNGHNVRYSGYGTQRIEDEIKALLPNANILRMDADTTSKKFSHEKLLKDFAEKKYDVMVGTQMVAKGLDFPDVKLVGIVNADNSLYSEEYNASEKSFDLMTQVIGRSGRSDENGLAVIQTINPYNQIIEYAAKQDYKSFYETEIELRQMLTYPPFCDLITILFLGKDELNVSLCAKSFFEKLVELNTNKYSDEKIIVLGPSPSKISKINNEFRYNMIIKCKNNKNIRKMITEILKFCSKIKEYKDISISVDLNPIGIN